MASSAEILTLSPSELRFRFELRKNVPCTLTLHNPTSGKVAFKVRGEQGERESEGREGMAGARGRRTDRFPPSQPRLPVFLSHAHARTHTRAPTPPAPHPHPPPTPGQDYLPQEVLRAPVVRRGGAGRHQGGAGDHAGPARPAALPGRLPGQVPGAGGGGGGRRGGGDPGHV